MNVLWLSERWRGFVYWIGNDPAIALKIATLVEDARRHPFTGLGKPEPLRGNYKGWWSRRITDEHRLVYRVTGSSAAQAIEIAQCRFHYG
jgi:toxin YoeB